MRYLDKTFTVGSNSKDAQEKYEKNYERIFGKKKGK